MRSKSIVARVILKLMFVISFFLLVGTAQTAMADSIIIVPNSLASTEGNSGNAFPFSISQSGFSLSSQRYQQVYAASQFSAVGGPMLITQILFRPDAASGDAFSSTLPDIQINMSTTPFAPDGLAATFASNVGPNDTIVYARGALSLSSADTAGPGGTRNFDIVITLTTPFLYDPAAGNLLLDVRNFGGGVTTFFDAQNTLGDSISRVYTFFGNVNSSTGDQIRTDGLVTAFNVQSTIPEPTSMLLLGSGLAGLTIRVCRRRTRRR